MSWLTTLDDLIADSRWASRQESAALLDQLLALPIAARWELFRALDPRLCKLSEADYQALFLSLNVHAAVSASIAEPGPSQSPEGPGSHRRSHRRRSLAPLALTVVAVMLVAVTLSARHFAADPAGQRRAERTAVMLADLRERNDRLTAVADDLGQQIGLVQRQLISEQRQELEAVRLALAVGRLRQTAAAGGPFAASLLQVRTTAAGAEPQLGIILQRLWRWAETGVPSIDQLDRRFETVIADLPEPGGLTRTVRWLATRLGLIEHTDPAAWRRHAVTVRARLHDRAGPGGMEVDAAMPPSLGAWIAGVRDRIELDHELDRLTWASLGRSPSGQDG